MGQYLAARRAPPPCDLSPEQIEEIRMLTLLPVEDIVHFRTRFLAFSTDDGMSKDAFLSIPVVAINPLRERLWSLFELTPAGDVAFPAFVAVMAVFTYHSSKDAKLRASFKLHDFDGDGRISKADLLAYLCLVADSGDKTDETEKDLDMVVTRTMEEVSSDGTADFLSFDDFARVVLSTEFETKLLLPL